MNDDFLYRIRVQPPEPFARELKARLDSSRAVRRRWLHVGVGIFVLGTAVAFGFDGVRDAVVALFTGRDVPVVTVQDARDDARRTGEESARAKEMVNRIVGESEGPGADAGLDDGVGAGAGARGVARIGVRGGNGPGTDTRIIQPVEPSVAKHHTPLPPDKRTANLPVMIGALQSYDRPDTPEGAFTKIWPLTEEPGSSDDAVKTRLALFNVMGWNARYLEYTFRGNETYDLKTLQTVALRLQALALMIDEAFAMDTRKTDLPTQARDEIWTDRATFRARAADMAEEADSLAYAATYKWPQSDLLARRAKRLILTCTACHRTFRQDGDIGTQTPRVPP